MLLLAIASPAMAQSPAQASPPAPAAPPAGTAPAFVIESDGGDNRLQIGGYLHADGRFFAGDDANSLVDTFTIRRLRSVLQGRVARYFEFYFNVDFAGGNVNVRDAYFDTRFSNAFRLRAGKAKVPVSYDRLILVANIVFVERGLPTAVAPDRDVGIHVLGDLRGNLVSYQASVTNGVIDGGSSDGDQNDGKDVAGRLVIRPFVGRTGSALAGLGVAIAGSTGVQSGLLPSFQTSGRQPFFTYAGAVADGRRTRWSPQVYYYRGPFGGYAEYVASRGGVQKAGVRADVEHTAWEVVASWVVTGETAGERNVRPRINFDPPGGHFGALQLAVRYHGLSVSPNALTLGFAAPGASREVRAWTAGVNWYLNPFVKWNVNFERTVFDGDVNGVRKPENAILLRAHLGF